MPLAFLFLDVVDSSLWSDLSSDAQEFEAESWSLVVDPSFCSRQEKDVIKRQDVIFGKHLICCGGGSTGFGGQSMDGDTVLTWVQDWFCHFPRIWPQTSYVAHLGLSFPICRAGIIIFRYKILFQGSSAALHVQISRKFDLPYP